MNKTAIEWTKNGYTWNPTFACTKVSDGCRFCYAEAIALRFGHSHHPWTAPFEAENVKLRPERLDDPFKVKPDPSGDPIYCFVDSMSDLFHRIVPDDFIARVWATMTLTPHITYQVLTKRPERMATLLASEPFADAVYTHYRETHNRLHARGKLDAFATWPELPLPNVWLGTSVEDQRVEDRIGHLIQTPAAIRFLSCEPLIGPLDLSSWLWYSGPSTAGPWHDGRGKLRERGGGFGGQMISRVPAGDIQWVITGGESGPHHRPFNPEWARQIRDECQDAGVAFFHKQNGGRTPKAGGRLLDGREWNQMPEAWR